MSGLDFTDQELTLARTMARRAAYKWSTLEREDVEAELYLWLCDNHSWVVRYRTDEGGKGKLAVALHRAAHVYCAGEQRATIGARKEDVQAYSRAQLCVLLRHVFDYSDWPQQEQQQHPVTGRPELAWDSGDGVAVLSDVTGAYWALSRVDRDVLAARFRDDLGYRALGERLGIHADAARKRVDRALDRMLVKLAGDVPWWVRQPQEGP